MLWRDHASGCYFCLTVISGFGQGMKVAYPDVESDDEVPGTSKARLNISCSSSDEASEWSGEEIEKNHKISQNELSDLCRDLYLTKGNSELLASRLKQWGYLAPETKVTYYRSRNINLIQFFLEKLGTSAFATMLKGYFEL